MATLESIIRFTGPLGHLTAYRRRDSDKIVFREKGGPASTEVKTAAHFINTRRNNAEFGARAKMAGQIGRGLWNLKPVINYNVHAVLNAKLKKLQLAERAEWGQRNVMLSRNPQILEGFSLTRSRLLESLVSVHFAGSINKEERSAELRIPALIPKLIFHGFDPYPYFKICAVLSPIADVVFNGEKYVVEGISPRKKTAVYEAPWTPCSVGLPAQTINLKLPDEEGKIPSLMLAVGLMFGKINEQEIIQPVRYAGSGKVIACV